MSRVTGNIVTSANATVNDLAVFFGMSASSKLNAVCSYSGLNKWARYKPVAWETLKGLTKANGHPTPLTLAELQSVSYGLTLPTSSTTPAQAAAKTFGYTPPTASDWCRISDFLNCNEGITFSGYNHAALAPARRGSFNSAMTFPIFSSSTISRGLIVSATGNTHTLALDDLTIISGCYLAFCWKDGVTTYIKTAADTITDGGIDITLEDTDFPNVATGGSATYTYYLCLCTTSHTSRTTASGKTYYPLPFDSASYATGTITVTKAWPFEPVTIEFGERESMVQAYTYNRTTQTWGWSGMGFYVYQMPSTGSDMNSYCRVNSNGDLYIRVKLVNSTDTELTYPASGTTAVWTSTLASNSTAAGAERSCYVYNADGASSTHSVTVAAGGTGWVYIKCPYFFRYYNGNNLGTLGTDLGRTGVFTLKANGIQVASAQLNFATIDYTGL